MRYFFVSLTLAILGFRILPSAYFTGDIVVHTMFIRKLQDPSLWQKDYTSNYLLKQNSVSIYYPAVAVITRISPLTYFQDQRILFFVYLVLLFWGLLLIGYKLEGSFWSGLILSLLLLLKFHIGGAAIETIETDFVPRGISMVVIIWSLYFYIKEKRMFAGILIGFSLVTHVLTGLYASWLYAIHFALKKWSILTLGKWLIAVFFLSVITILFTDFKIDEPWLGVLRLRNTYAFLDTWSPKDWFNLSIALIPGCIYLYRNKTRGDRIAQLIILAIGGSIILTFLNLIFTSIYPIHEVIVLQFGRSWILAIYVSLFGGTVLLLRQIRERSARSTLTALLLISVIYFNYLRTPLKLDAWQEVSSWAVNYTSRNCIFLTPFITPGFRVESDRAIAGDYKDGTFSLYSREFAIEWKLRHEELKNWEDATNDKLHELQNKYGINYIVSQRKIDGYPILFKNVMYTVYGVQSTSECKII